MIALVDADVICYQACYGVWQNYIDKQNKVIELDENGNKKPLILTQSEERGMLEACWRNFKTTFNFLIDYCYCSEFLGVVKGKNNFRDHLYPEYKQTRHVEDPLKRNRFVPILRRLAVAEDYAIEATGRESDDYIRIWAEEAREAGDPFCVMSNDKDFGCIPGKHVNIHRHSGVTLETWKPVIFDVSPEEATRYYYSQLLSGDNVDNIPGIPGVAEKTALKLLKGCSTEEQMQEIVVGQYMASYGDEWYEYLLSNGKMIHLQKNLNDYFSIRNWPVVGTVM